MTTPCKPQIVDVLHASSPTLSARVICGFVALSRFTIRNGLDAEVRKAFVGRPHLVDAATGFLGMEVMSPVENAAEIWLLTRWTDENSYRTWHRSHSYHDSHSGIPKGLKLVPGSAEIILFNVFAD
ncbi:MAG: antibiotic biosynthesis monooxygenase family protein [Thiobacillus sp.]